MLTDMLTMDLIIFLLFAQLAVLAYIAWAVTKPIRHENDNELDQAQTHEEAR